MNAGEALIQAAKAAQRERVGLRIKARVPSPLWSDVKRCANACGWSAEEWVCAICRMYAKGRLGVPTVDYSGMGTREESEPVWVRVPIGFKSDSDNLRKALAAGVEWYVPKIPKPVTNLVEGKDYFIEGRSYSGAILQTLKGRK